MDYQSCGQHGFFPDYLLLDSILAKLEHPGTRPFPVRPISGFCAMAVYFKYDPDLPNALDYDWAEFTIETL